MKIVGVVVLYNPQLEVLENIATYLPFVEKLYVVDNSTQEYAAKEKLLAQPKIEYVAMGGNKGIALALKIACEKAIAAGCDFILTMDQDSKYPTDDFKFIKDYLAKIDDKVALISINYTGSKIPLNNETDKSLVQECDQCITSGTIINLKSYQNIAGFNADLFIDLVDHDLGYQFLVKGYKLVIFPNIVLEHSLGRVQVLKFLWLKKERHIHSPLRYYYMYRNYTYLKKYSTKEYKKLLKKYHKKYGLLGIVKKVLLQKDHYQVYKMISKGIHDGKRGILGPYKENQ